jgi:hypothetical protein
MKYNSLCTESKILLKFIIALILSLLAIIGLFINIVNMPKEETTCTILVVIMVPYIIFFFFCAITGVDMLDLNADHIMSIHGDNSIILSFVLCKIHGLHKYTKVRTDPTKQLILCDKVCVYCGKTSFDYTNYLRLTKELHKKSNRLEQTKQKYISNYYSKLTKEEQKEVFVEKL